MIAVLALLFFAANNQLTLAKVQAEKDPVHRARAAVEYAAIAERAAEQASDNGDNAALKASIADMVTAMELARDSFMASGKTPSRNPGTFKTAELQSHEILHRLADLKDKLDVDQRPLLDQPIIKIERIHDDWFYGIMGRKK